ncbi:MAG: tetratricopeptide repeat protein [Phycisphaerales bacterium]
MARRPSAAAEARIDAQINDAVRMQQAGQLAQAVEMLRRLVPKAPNHFGLNYTLAKILLLSNQPEQAKYFLERTETIAPDHPDVLLIGAHLCEASRDAQGAVDRYDKILAQRPNDPEALSGKSKMLIELERPDEATECLRRAIAAAPNEPGYRAQLGVHTLENGQPHDACVILREACALTKSDPSPYASLAYAMNYDHLVTPEDVLEAHAAYGRIVERGIPPKTSFPNAPDPDRTLRVAFVSRDMREHSVAYFFEPILEHHDPDKIFMACYSLSRHKDDVTARLESHADLWRDAGPLDFTQLCEQFAKDRIDVAIDLSGLGAGNRLLAFAARPAPVSITYCGYPNTTGLTRMTARLIDAITDPPPTADALAAEKLVRIDGCFLCYRPMADAPAPKPDTGNERVVFGSFNATKKYTPQTLDAWAEILKRVPDAKLVLKHRRMRIPDVQKHFRDELASRGVDPDRIDLRLAVDDTAGHLAVYDQIDIGLDPFPYNGTTTTCEALWMGVPVVGLAGDRHQARVGASLLHAVGLDELVGDSMESYTDKAVALAEDADRRRSLRAGMRERVANSILCDGPGFADRFERAVRGVWRSWCENPV